VNRVRTVVAKQEIGPRGSIVQKEYDAAGNLIRVIGGSGAKTTYEYNDLHLCIRRTNPDGNSWTFDYDEVGRPIRVVNPGGGVWKFSCSGHGRIERVKNPRGDITTFAHDRFGNCVRKEDPDGTSTHYTYDLFGRLTELKDRRKDVFAYAYDPRGWLKEVGKNGRHIASYTYDADGHITEFVGARSQRVTLRYSVWGYRIARSILRAQPKHASDIYSTTLFEYDNEGRLTKIVDPGERTFAFTYDACGRKSTTLFGDGSLEQFEYDLSGNIIQFLVNGQQRIRYEYDLANRIVAKDVSRGGQSRFSYDVMGRIVLAANDSTTVSFQYDAMGNPIEEKQGAAVIRRSFDSMGNCTALELDKFARIAYEYDSLQRPVEIAGPQSGSHRFSHGNNFACPTKHEHPNGLVDRCEYDRVRGVIIQETTPKDFSKSYSKRERQCLVDDTGRVNGWSDARGGTRAFQFDELGRLTAVNDLRGTIESFEYDASNNVIRAVTSNRAYDERNRIVRADAFRYDYVGIDACVRIDESTGSRVSYDFDGQGRLLSVIDQDGGSVSFRYDAFGRRIAKSGANNETKFWWDGTNVLRETDSASDEDSCYVFFPRTFRPLAKVCRRRGASDKVQEFDYHLDLVGTPQAVSDESGLHVWSAEYGSYGEALIKGDPAVNHLRFPGQYYDAETGLHYNLHRYYDPRLGRYISEDPIGFLSSSLNLYAYPTDPINRSDPLGLDCGDPDAVHIYHGTLDEDKLRETGFTTKDKYGGEALPPFVCVSTDRGAAADAINPRTRVDAQDAPAPAVLTGSMSRAEWDQLHAQGHLDTPNKNYGGFGGGLQSSETKARTPEGVSALNRAFRLPGG
jgi:RHS repeat-associated protein